MAVIRELRIELIMSLLGSLGKKLNRGSEVTSETLASTDFSFTRSNNFCSKTKVTRGNQDASTLLIERENVFSQFQVLLG